MNSLSGKAHMKNLRRATLSGVFLTLSFLAILLLGNATLLAQVSESNIERQDDSTQTPIRILNTGSINGAFYAGDMASPMSAPTTLGATVGGAQDIGYTRQLIDAGRVPNFIDFSPEGLYSEHDIPTPDSDCNQKLCLSLGYGFAPAADTKQPALFVHLGMTSGIRPEDFKRPPLQLALVIDQSGSMGNGQKMASVQEALRSLLKKLAPDDVLTLVTFTNKAHVLLPPTKVKNRADILQIVNQLKADGSTNIEAGLTVGFNELAKLETTPGYQKRLILFTDARPNVGRTDSASFQAITEKYAQQGIGLTAFGVGLEFGQQLVYHISQLRGGNFFFLETPEKIANVFDTEFDYLVTPIVYDLNVNIATPKGLKLTAVYGLPTWKPGDLNAELHIPTVFFSSNRGAIILRYERDDEAAFSLKRGALLADGSMSYTNVNGNPYSSQVSLRHQGKKTLKPGVQYYTHEGMRTAVALTNVYFALRDACTLYTQNKREEALEVIGRAKGLIVLENLTLNDSSLKTEVAMLEQLAENIETTEPQPVMMDKDKRFRTR